MFESVNLDYSELIIHCDQSFNDCQSALEWMLKPVSSEHSTLWAKALINKFGSLANALSADIYNVAIVLDGNSEPALYLNKLKQIFSYISKCNIRHKPIFQSWDLLIDYLKLEMGQLMVEQLRLLLLNSSSCLIDDKILSNGSIKEVQCYPRQVARQAVIMNASVAILVHNHPSGDPRMSKADTSITYEVQEACNAVGVHLYDHLVICRDNYSSFRRDNPLWARI